MHTKAFLPVSRQTLKCIGEYVRRMAGLALLLHVSACASTQQVGQQASNAMLHASSTNKTLRTAVAVLQPLSSSGCRGTLTLTELPQGGVKIEGVVSGLAPESVHGFHVHEKGDCSAMDGSSAGGHFNPTHQPHGEPRQAASHVGDFGNIQANTAGQAEVFSVHHVASLDDTSTSLVGRAIIVHKAADDFKTQPSGASGDRIACAVIQRND